MLAHDDLFCARCGGPTRGATATGPVTGGPPGAGPTAVASPQRASKAPFWVAGIVLALVAGVGGGVYLTHRGDSAGNRATGNQTTSAAAPSASSTSSGQGSVSTSATPTPTPTQSLAQVYARQQSGVVRIEVLECGDSQGVGTGFLLSPTLVATVDHVVASSVVVSLGAGDQHTTGTVIGHDPQSDLALVRAAEPLTGFHFHFSQAAPSVGDQVAAVGFPVGDPMTLTQGNVSGLGRDIDVDGFHRTGLIETDAAVNPGNSGGPLMASDGSVVGLVDALRTDANGIAYAVPATQAGPALNTWAATPSPLAAARCDNPTGPSGDTGSVDTIPGLPPDVAAAVSQAFSTYFGGINSNDFASAYGVFSERLQAQTSLQSLADGDADSVDFGQTVIAAHLAGDGSAKVALAFTSLQSASQGPGGSGDTCDDWTLVYTMIDGGDGTWRIDGTTPYHGSSYTSC